MPFLTGSVWWRIKWKTQRSCPRAWTLPFFGGGRLTGGSTGGAPQIELPKAIPEDVQAVVSKWQAIIGSADNPMKMYLKSSKPSLGSDGKLMIVLQDGLASDYFTKGEGNKEQLERLLSEFPERNAGEHTGCGEQQGV